MPYIEGFVAAVPTANKDVYRKHAKEAVALFKSLSDDPDSLLLADTVTEQLTGDLARLPGTVVMAHAVLGVDCRASHLIQGRCPGNRGPDQGERATDRSGDRYPPVGGMVRCRAGVHRRCPR